MAKADAGRGPDAVAIRPAMDHGVAHPLYPRRIDRLGRRQVENSGDPAHANKRLVEAGHAVHPIVDGPGGLAGTGKELLSQGGDAKGHCNEVPTVPGEIIQLELLICDVEDSVNNSLVVLDNWVWNVDGLQGLHE